MHPRTNASSALVLINSMVQHRCSDATNLGELGVRVRACSVPLGNKTPPQADS